MGGLAFADIRDVSGKAPRVPRLTPELYHDLAKKHKGVLETIFSRVAIPREAPGKKDHGDIDFLVDGTIPTLADSREIWGIVGDALGAKLNVRRGGSHSYGILHPEDEGAFVQVDVELCPQVNTTSTTSTDVDLFAWTHYMKSDSDLLQIIGISHRSLGLINTDQGLHVRVAEIEPYDKKKSLLLLTRDPNRALAFYGFDVEKYWNGFEDEFDLFRWVVDGRFFSKDIFEERVEKSNDRSRKAKRAMYRNFVEDFMPTVQAAAPEADPAKIWTRDQVLQEALDFFDAREEYNAMIAVHDAKECEESFWNRIRETVPVEGSNLTFVLKSLRRWVAFEQGQPQIATVPCLEDQIPWTTVMEAGSEKEVLSWVAQNWQQAKVLEKARAVAAKQAAGQNGAL